MEITKAFDFTELEKADLVIDALYKSGSKGNSSDEPIGKILKVGNQGGFRYSGSVVNDEVKLVVLYTTLYDVDWPDLLDYETGVFYYYGDNKKPGHNLHDTPRKGNLLLSRLFERTHSGQRGQVPPIFVFSKAGEKRDVIFRGLVVPGAESIPVTDDLVAIWKTYDNKRFQNYRAIFSILDVPKISREWINDILKNDPLSENCPKEWKEWSKTGSIKSLKAQKTKDHRVKDQQLPKTKTGVEILELIRKYFSANPYRFEKFAAELLKIADLNVKSIEITRPHKDGGRDAIGEYKLQIGNDGIILDFAMEAKCYGAKNAVGVKETSRLISRLRHRQFGILVTTSYVGEQAYKEIREDTHPILIVAAIDIYEILVSKGFSTVKSVKQLLGTFQN